MAPGASDDLLRAILSRVSSSVWAPGDMIVRYGEFGRDMFFIKRGEGIAPPALHTSCPTNTAVNAVCSKGAGRRRGHVQDDVERGVLWGGKWA